jgi:hypothetical protein
MSSDVCRWPTTARARPRTPSPRRARGPRHRDSAARHPRLHPRLACAALAARRSRLPPRDPSREDAARDELERAVATLPEEVKAEAAFLHGEAAMESQVADLICGKLRTAPAVRPGTDAPDAGVRLRV